MSVQVVVVVGRPEVATGLDSSAGTVAAAVGTVAAGFGIPAALDFGIAVAVHMPVVAGHTELAEGSLVVRPLLI